MSRETGGKFANGASSGSFAHTLGQAVHGHVGDPVLDGFNGIGRVIGEINSNDVWQGVKNVNTFSMAATIGFSTDLKTLPFATFFAASALATDVLLLFSPSDGKSLSDTIGSGLVDEFIPGNGFKSMTVREFLKYGVNTYDD